MSNPQQQQQVLERISQEFAAAGLPVAPAAATVPIVAGDKRKRSDYNYDEEEGTYTPQYHNNDICLPIIVQQQQQQQQQAIKERKNPGPSKTVGYANETTTTTLQLSNEKCTHDGCTYHAITRKPLCIFHIDTEESQVDTFKRNLNGLPKNPSVKQLEDKVSALENELEDVKKQLENAKQKEEAQRLAAQEEAMPNLLQLDDGNNVAYATSTSKTLKNTPGYRSCRHEGCTNYAIRSGVCVKHGAGPSKKQCKIEGCTNQSVKGGVCCKHGAKLKLCSAEGCSNLVQKKGVCNKHGACAYAKICDIEGCTNQARKAGLCRRHGNKVECNVEGCTNCVQKGGVCWSHGANVSISRVARGGGGRKKKARTTPPEVEGRPEMGV